MLKSLYDSVKVNQSLEPAVRTADDTTATAVDTMGYNSALIVVNAGATVTAGGETYTFNVQASADGSTNWSTVASVAITAANSVGIVRLDDLLNRARYLQVVLDVGASGSPSCACAATILLGNPLSSPVNS